MTKITIINCIIVAVCILQTAEAGFFDKSPLNSLLDNVNKQVSNTLDNVKGAGEKIQNQGKEMIDGVKNKIGATTGLQERSEACTKLYAEGEEALNEMISIFSSCITNQTGAASEDIQRLTDAVNILKSNLTKDFQDALQCFKNPFTAIPCFTNVYQDVVKLGPVIEESIYAAYELLGILPNVRTCYDTALQQLIGQTMNKLVQDAKDCAQSFIPFK